LIAKSHRWQKTAAAAAIALLSLSTTGAWALSLGRITVQSALGEPLRAEIDVPEINAEEASTLKAVIASAEAFAAAGLEYNPAMSSLQATLQRRLDGRAYIRLSSDRAINDPFVDMIVEASGHRVAFCATTPCCLTRLFCENRCRLFRLLWRN
jgi:pilus assembly protein FimV